MVVNIFIHTRCTRLHICIVNSSYASVHTLIRTLVHCCTFRIFARIRPFLRICAYSHPYAHTLLYFPYIRTYPSAHTHLYILAYVRSYTVVLSVYIRTSPSVHTHLHILTRSYTLTYVYTYTRTQTHYTFVATIHTHQTLVHALLS